MLFGRRVRFALIVMVSQLLLIAMAVAWVIHMVLIAQHGRVYFIEDNPAILYTEIGATVVITVFAIIVFILQLKRLGERRCDDNRRDNRAG